MDETVKKYYYSAYTKVKERLPDDKGVLVRLERALEIVQGFGYDIAQELDNDTHWVVRRASTSLLEDNSAEYHIDSESCSCPDFEIARAGLCKHRLAVFIIQEAGFQQQVFWKKG